MNDRFGIRCWGFGLATVSALTMATVVCAEESDERTLADVLETSSEDVRLYNEHLVTLANPVMEGRVPGSRGMELAKEYCEFWFRDAGLTPPFPLVSKSADGSEVITPNASWRQPFDLGGNLEAEAEEFWVVAGDEEIPFEAGEEFAIQGMGGSNELTAPLVFVGYSIDNGPDDYSSYAEDDSLEGKIAVMFRFEPMDEDGASLWSDGGRWSNKASFANKLRGARKRDAAAIIIVNTPGADDPRVGQMLGLNGNGNGTGTTPVLMMTPEAAEKMLASADDDGRSLMELRVHADEGGGIIELAGSAHINAKIKVDPLVAENVAGVLPGRGELKDEYIVVGAHLDHLGMGYFGSRSGPGKLHPGADDNASGSAGVLLFAKMLAEAYAETPEDVPLRSVLFMCFSGEESGLNGSRAYVNDPLIPIEQHYLMINFDMIGRIKDGRLSIGGSDSAEGLRDMLEPLYEASSLTVIAGKGMTGASDHTSFYAEDIPVLMGSIADFHKDYHTPEDVSWKINRVGAVETIELFNAITYKLATHPESLTFSALSGGGRPGGNMSNIKVRFGVMPDYNAGDMGVGISDVTDGSSAGEAGVLAGDVLVRWDGQKIEDIQAWMEMLANHKPGDKIKVGVKRDGEEVTLDVTLQAK